MSGRKRKRVTDEDAAELSNAITDLTDLLHALDPRFNAHRVARYEFMRACRALDQGPLSVRANDVEGPIARFRHMTAMLPADRRREARRLVDRIVEAAASMAADDRLAAVRASAFGDGGWLVVPQSIPEQPAGELAPATFDLPHAVVTTKRHGALGNEIETLLRILRCLPRGLEYWAWDGPARGRDAGQIWDVRTERHVQSILWLALAPSLPDLTWEENLESVGPKHPRVDLALPALQLVLEIKLVRKNADFASVIEQVSADASLYTARVRERRMVVFVWDDTRSSEKHGTLVQGLTLLDPVVETVVMSRPARMSAVSK